MTQLKPILSFLFFFIFSFFSFSNEGFLHADGIKIVNGTGENVLLRGIGTGNWMLMEGYMMKTGGVAGTQHEFRAKLEKTIGEEKTEEFFDTWLNNHFTRTDVDSMKAWGFNSVRAALHYLWLTPPIEDEPVPGEITWIEKGFERIDSLLDWCSDNEMYLILDMHGTPGGQGKNADISDYDTSKPSLWESKANQDKLTALWYKLAERYKDEAWIGGYDLINETNWDFENSGNQNGLNNVKNIPLLEMHKRLIDTIRTVDNNHLVYVSGNSWGNNYNGMNSLAAHDENLAYTFHKYWNTNNSNDVDWIDQKRKDLNVPLWMSESGENSNTWFTEAISLFETNNIGWSWWPVKKEGINNVLGVSINKEYEDLIKYWKGEINTAPSGDEAFSAVMQWAENHKIENCKVQYDVIDAMIRQPHSTETKAFKQHNTEANIYFSDYDFGRNEYAYYDEDVANYGGDFVAWNAQWVYRNDGVDMENCADETSNGVSVGWINSGEWMLYTIDVDSFASYSCDIRYAANGSNGKFHWELDGTEISNLISLPSTGAWYNWNTYTFEGIILPKGKHQLKFYVDNSGFNLNFFKLYNPQALETTNPEILSIKTDESGTKLKLISNLGFKQDALPTSDDFELKVGDAVKNIVSIEIDSLNNRVLNLILAFDLIQADRVYLSYSGTSMKSPSGILYPTFSKLKAKNNAPFFFVLPTKIQAENFTINQGFGLENCSDTGSGLNLSYANSGDYTEYNIYVPEAGDFKFLYRAASGNSGRFKMQLLQHGELTDLHTISVSTNGWQKWETVSAKASLPAGKFVLRLYAISGEFNLNWIEVDINTNSKQTTISSKEFRMIQDEEMLVVYNLNGLDQNCKIELFDLLGQKIMTRSLEFNGESKLEFPAEACRNGLYIVKISTKNAFDIQKIYLNF